MENLHELSRKELKQLCNEHSIRTAGVKHDDLVRLLRTKLHPPATDSSRLGGKSRSRMSTDSQLSSKSTSEVSEKTSRSTASQGANQRSDLVFADDSSQDKTPEWSTTELSPSRALPRKPIIAKSNSTPPRRSDFLRKKVNTLSGLGKQSQEKRPQQRDGPADKSRSNVGAQRPSTRNASMAVKRPGDRLVVKNSETQKSQSNNSDSYSRAASSPRASEGDASATAVDSSDLGSHSFGSVSEIATVSGHHAMPEDSDNDDGRSVSSEPALMFPSQINKLTPRRSTGSKLSRGVYSSWDSGQGGGSLHSLARSNEVRGQDSDDLSSGRDGEEIFPYFLEDVDSLVSDTDGLDSFLDGPIADPEDVNRADGHQVDFEQFHTSEISTPRHQDDGIIDREGSMRGEVAIGYNNEAALAANHPEFELGNSSLVNYEATPILVSSGQEKIGETSVVLFDPLHTGDQVAESRGLGNECSSVSEDFFAGERSPRDNVDLPELLTVTREASEVNQAASPTCLTSDGNPVRNCIQHTKSAPGEPDKNRSDVKWSFASALYDDLEDLQNTVDIGGYGLLEQMLPEGGEARNNSIEDFEPLKDQSGTESYTKNHVELGVESFGGEDKEEVGTTSSSLVGVAQSRGPSPNEIASKSDELKKAGSIFQKGSMGIAFNSDSYPPVICATGGEATSDCHEHAGAESYLSIPSDFDSPRSSKVPKVSGVLLNASERNIKPFSWGVDKDEAEETANVDGLLRSGPGDVSGANSFINAEGERSRSHTLIQETIEGLGEENASDTSTEMEEETEVWSASEEEDPGVPIQRLTLSGEIESSCGSRDQESRLPSSEDQDGILHNDRHSLGLKQLPDLVPDKLEKPSHDNSPARSHPRKMGQILSVGLKVIIVIGSITFGILKFRASRHRFARSS